MVTQRVRRVIRQSGGGINVVADVNAVIATGDGVTSSATVTTVTQTNGKTRRTTRGAGDGTRGEQ
jgi:hypothetical protein